MMRTAAETPRETGVWGASLTTGATWGVGVALGVLLGAYLTVTSGTGAPGAASLDPGELIMLPLVSGVVAFVLIAGTSFVYRSVVARPRGGSQDQK